MFGKENVINQSVSTKIKVRDFAIGFFGWIILHHLYLLIYLTIGVPPFSGYEIEHLISLLFLWLPLLIVPSVGFAKFQAWIAKGIVSAIIIDIAIWIVLSLIAGGLPSWSPWAYLAFPLPLGLYLFLT